MTPRLASLVGSVVVGLAVIAPLTRAACECGYLDPATNALWTDATITYFNETGLADVVTIPAQSPNIYGNMPSGSTGEGQQAWAVIGNHVNEYEESFGATFRSAVSYNNTYIDDISQGLAMQVSPANLKTRIVNGSQIVTRRRDILYGSFRASIQPAITNNEGGTGFKFAVAYNESETIDTTIYRQNGGQNVSLDWSYSASSQDAMPRKLNYTWLEVNSSLPLEQRMDWLNHKEVEYRNGGHNASISFAEYVKKHNATNLPTTPAPVSFQAWSNGEPSGSQGPPLYNPVVTRILYARFFFNSTLAQRDEQFKQQCMSTLAPICSTEDHTLRNSTIFSLEALNQYKKKAAPFKAPMFAIYVESAIIGIAVLIIFHGVFVRRRQNAEKKLMLEAAKEEEREKPDTESIDGESFQFQSEYNNSSHHVSLADKIILNPSPDSILPPLPDLTQGWDSDSEFESEDEYEEMEPISGNIEARSFKFERVSSLPRFTKPEHSPLASPPATLDRNQSYRFDSSSLGLFNMHASSKNNNTEASPLGNVPDFDDFASSPTENSQPRRKSILKRKSSTPQPLLQNIPREFHLQAEPAIVRWGKRHGDGGEVGQLAAPRHSIAVSNRRQSVIFVRQTLVQNIFNKARDAIFISGPVAKTSLGVARVDYLDGLRGFACLFVSVGHFILMFYPGIANAYSPRHYPQFEYWMRAVLQPIIVNAPLLLGIFFALPARTMCQRYLLKGGLLSMADSTVRRMPRIMIPVLGACLANYLMIDTGAYKWVPRLASRTWSNWAYFQNFDNVLDFVNSFISLWWAAPPSSPALVTRYATGVLWTIPLIIQGMWTCMLSALVAHEMKTTWKRFSFYAICIALSWYANTWDAFFMGGLVIADLDANLHYREKSAKGIPVPFYPKVRIKGSYFAWIFMIAAGSIQWLAAIGKAGSLLTIQEFGIHPDWNTATPHNWDNTNSYSYMNPEYLAWIWIMSIFVLADLSNVFQTFFRLRIWSFLGKHSMGYYLCHGIIFWTWGSWLCITLLTAGAHYWVAVLITFITSYFWLTLLCICFTATFEYWSIMFSKALWRASSNSLGRKV